MSGDKDTLVPQPLDYPLPGPWTREAAGLDLSVTETQQTQALVLAGPFQFPAPLPLQLGPGSRVPAPGFHEIAESLVSGFCVRRRFDATQCSQARPGTEEESGVAGDTSQIF